MAFVEYLRVRRALVIYAIVVALITLLVTTSLNVGNVHIHSDDPHMRDVQIPLAILLGTSAFCALIFGTIISPSLNRERETLALSWTRPIPRERLALSCVLVDCAAFVAAFVVTLALGAVPLISTGLLERVYADPLAPGAIVVTFGVALMWYGLVQAATSWYRGRAGLAVGLSWGLFAALILIGHTRNFGPLVTAIVGYLNYLNPLAYLPSYSFDKSVAGVHASSYLMLPETVGGAIVWSVGIVACAIAIVNWKRSEA